MNERGRVRPDPFLFQCQSVSLHRQKRGVAQWGGVGKGLHSLVACIKNLTVSSAGGASNGPSVPRRRSRVTVGSGGVGGGGVGVEWDRSVSK